MAKTLVSKVSSAIFCANIQSPSFRREAPLADPFAGGIELVDVHHLPVPDSVPRAGVGSDDIKMLLGIVLRSLLRREP
jgi:hypothetical protein